MHSFGGRGGCGGGVIVVVDGVFGSVVLFSFEVTVLELLLLTDPS